MKKKLAKNAFDISNILKILSNSERLTILCFIDKDERDVGSIIKHTNTPQSTISNHLSLLKRHEILEVKKSGRNMFYSIKNKKILSLMKELKKIFL